MDIIHLIPGVLLYYLCFIPVLTFHEFAHAWVAWKCGDDTAKKLGRVSLNPIVHMEWIGTVVLPLLAIFLQMKGSAVGGFIIGWGKPVPVDPSNLRSARRDDTLIALAGPGMNLILAFLLTGTAVLGMLMVTRNIAPGFGAILRALSENLVWVNLSLAFFNMIPIPPLDGSHVVKNLVNMSYETYWRLTQYGFFAIILVINVPGVRLTMAQLMRTTHLWMLRAYGLG